MKIKGLTLLLYLSLLFSTTTLAIPYKPDLDSVDAGETPNIVLTLFIHDQLDPGEIITLGPDYLEWFIKELSHVTGRRIQIITVAHTPGMTDFGYRQGDSLQALSDWRSRVMDYIEAKNLPRSTKRHKYILITRYKLTSEVLGIAFSTSGVAIASIRSYNTLGHEVGHLLGATHENAETRLLSLPPCRTLMYPEHNEFIANCFEFSAKNRQAIHEYVNGDRP